MAGGLPEESFTLVLKRPIEVEGKLITELVIKEPTAGQMAMAEQTSKGDTDQGIVMLGLSCGFHPNVIKNLAGSDYVKAQKALGNFFKEDQDDGDKP